jgi:hypothetical protein
MSNPASNTHEAAKRRKFLISQSMGNNADLDQSSLPTHHDFVFALEPMRVAVWLYTFKLITWRT